MKLQTKSMLALALVVAAIAAWLGAQPAERAELIARHAEPARDVTVSTTDGLPVTFDGHVSKFEYADAAAVRFPNGHGTVDARVKVADGHLYFAFELPDGSPHPGDDIVIMLDTGNQRSETPHKDDIRAYIRRKSENSRMHKGDGKGWVNLYGPWEYRHSAYAVGWEVEARIPLTALDLDPATAKTVGLAFRIWDNEPQKIHNWPIGSDERKPSTWGTLTLKP